MFLVSFPHARADTEHAHSIDRSHVTTAIWWPLGVAVVSVTCMRVRWVSHTWKPEYTQWNIFLFQSSHKSSLSTNPCHMGFRYEASLNFYTYSGQCPNDTYILLHIPLHVCPNYPHTGLTTATAPSGHQMAVVTWDRSIGTCIGRTCRQPSFPRWKWLPGVMFLTFLWPQSGRATPSWAVINTISPLF